ncbi:MAG: hypothetical protein A2252_11710 [Elusimicrobia bacterium RIFOXYA2_FULL_39_19]|nr:MAG: hypothetical protein A2252_11710 [Elusimicrobia bacterium RIFOXYA2_FULL_39_19]
MDLAKSEIKKHNGLPALFVNGKLITPMTYRCQYHYNLKYMKSLYDCGYRLFFYDQKWDGVESWEEHFKRLDEKLKGILAFGPDHYIILSVYTTIAPAWAKKYPGECVWTKDGIVKRKGNPPGAKVNCNSDSAIFSYASEIAEKEVCEFIKAYVKFAQSRPYANRIAGFFIESGECEEWFWVEEELGFDYSPAMKNAFKKFLKNKYSTTAGLQKAWGDPKINFEKVKIPTTEEIERGKIGIWRDPIKDKKVIDVLNCKALEIADMMIACAKTVKNASKGNSIVGFFHEPLAHSGPGTHHWKKVIESPLVDFTAGPPIYDARGAGQFTPEHTITGSMHLHNKLFFSEDDIRTFNNKPYNKDIYFYGRDKKDRFSAPGRQLRRWTRSNSVEETLELLTRDLANNIITGSYGWWYDFSYCWYNHPTYLKYLEKMQEIFELSWQSNRRSVAQIAVLVDEESMNYQNDNARLSNAFVDRFLTQELFRVGAPVDIYLHDDLKKPDFPLSQYKLVIVLNCQVLSNDDRKTLEKIKSASRTVLFMYGAGVVNPDKSAGQFNIKNMQELTGIKYELVDDKGVFDITVLPEAQKFVEKFADYGSSFHLKVSSGKSDYKLNSKLPVGTTFGRAVRYLDSGETYDSTENTMLFSPAFGIGPLFIPVDKEAELIGVYSSNNLPAAATKKFNKWRSIYIGSNSISAVVLREIARLAGVHIYSETDDVFLANESILMVHGSRSNAERLISLPENKKYSYALEMVKNKKIKIAGSKLKITLSHGKTGLYLIK